MAGTIFCYLFVSAPSSVCGGRLNYAAHVTGGCCSILQAVLPQGWQILLWDGCMVFGFTVYVPTDLLKFVRFQMLFCCSPFALGPDWSSCLVELLLWFFPLVLGVLLLGYQVRFRRLGRRPKARFPKGTDPRNGRPRLNERSGGPKFSVR